MRQRKNLTYSQFSMVPLQGRTLSIQETLEVAVRTAVQKLLEQSFTRWTEALEPKLCAEGSEWTAHVMEIGTTKGSFLVSLLTTGDPQAIPFVRPLIPPTLAVSAARWMPDGLTELVVMTILRMTGALTMDGAGERPSNALGYLVNEFTVRRQLISVSRPQPVSSNVECPAHPRKLRKPIGRF